LFVNLVTDVTDTRDPVPVGEQFSWVVTVRNTGTGVATGVAVRDRISRAAGSSANLSFVGNPFAQPGFACTTTAGGVDFIEITCTGGTIPAGGSATLTFNVTALSPGVFTNTATADPGNAIVESDEGDNVDTEFTTLTGLT
jgi:uncharacterized repeat protein (TIGR01451 family)